MSRTTRERMNNKHGHHYQRDGSFYICHICGTAEHRNGNFWWAGRYSKCEPPCGDDIAGQDAWFDAAEIEGVDEACRADMLSPLSQQEQR
ncbi:hypothetical protein U3D69_003210 [Salmonella enterica]|nr:hypothetical protein [Salmonella enterica]EEB4926592.1 hypothetical protein [Salmonella enterica subsp. enterica serovar Brandenburg]EBM5554588.1 hypothetical protein [Salmonella enterica]EFR8798612.1 hypothetical protein [Salmonella enterica]EJE5640756.1 hypothetical protein [Salmonella enterica]